MAARKTKSTPSESAGDAGATAGVVAVGQILAIAKSPGDPRAKIDRIIAVCQGG